MPPPSCHSVGAQTMWASYVYISLKIGHRVSVLASSKSLPIFADFARDNIRYIRTHPPKGRIDASVVKGPPAEMLKPSMRFHCIHCSINYAANSSIYVTNSVPFDQIRLSMANGHGGELVRLILLYNHAHVHFTRCTPLCLQN